MPVETSEILLVRGEPTAQLHELVFTWLNPDIRFRRLWGTEVEKQYWTLQMNGVQTADTWPLAIVHRPGYIVGVKAAALVKAGAASSATYDVKVNGTSVLNAVITLDNTGTNRVPVTGVLTGTRANLACLTNDVLEVVTTIAGGTPPTDTLVSVEWIPQTIQVA